MDRLAVEAHRPALGAQNAHHRGERRGLAHAVAPEQCHDLARADRQIDPEQHPAVAVAGFETLDFEHHESASPR